MKKKSAVVIPEPRLTRAQRRELMSELAEEALYRAGDPAELVEEFVLQDYFGGWSGESYSYFCEVKKTLHHEVGMHLALAVAKLVRNQLAESGAARRVVL